MSELKIYRSIDSLPLWHFAKVIETNDLRYLIISDYYDILPEAQVDPNIWDAIMIEYFEQTDTQKIKKYVQDSLHLLKLRRRYNIVTNGTFVLCHKKDIELIKIVEKHTRDINSNFVFKYETDKEYYESIVEADRNANSLNDLITFKSKEYEQKYAKKGNDKFDLYQVLNALQRFYKMQFDPKQLVVRQFISMQKDMVKEINAQKNGKR